jgi:tetratricopeptide (TPR) repeat protein
MDETPTAPQEFTQRRLPWLLGAATLVLYLVSLNHWLRNSSIPAVSELSQWEGLQAMTRPLLWLLSRPLRLVPETQFPAALNALAAVFGAVSVGLIARCVALLPHDRTRAQRVRGHSEETQLHIPLAWLPPVFAATLLGLQLTFWEHATAQTGEMLHLMLFAGCVWCLLEYRTSLDEAWLGRFALIYGLSIPENWAMIAFFPLFLVALVWIRGLSILDTGLLVRMLSLGLAGLSLYLLMPVASLFISDRGYTVLDVLRVSLETQRDTLRGLPRGRFLLLAVVNLLPLALVGIRWSGTKASSSLERMLSDGSVIALQLGWLGAAVFMALDRGFSQRQIIYLDPQFGGIPLLTYYFCAALAAGYFMGYFLLVGGVQPERVWDQPSPGVAALTKLAWAGMILLGLATPVALAVRNFPRIQSQNGPQLETLASVITASLPKEPSLVLSDDPFLCSLLTGYFIQNPGLPPHMIVNGGLARQPWYRQRLLRVHGGRWPELSQFAGATQDVAMQFMTVLRRATTEQRGFIANPSLSFITEAFEMRPAGLLFRLSPFAKKAVDLTPLTPAEVSEITTFWSQHEAALTTLESSRRFGLPAMRQLCELWSRQANYHGVQLQESGKLEEAKRLFEVALRINPDNGAAKVNQTVNASLKAHQPLPPDAAKPISGRYPLVTLSYEGPADEPTFLQSIARVLQSSSEPFGRSVLLRLARAHQLAPDSIPIAIAYAEACRDAGVPDRALATVRSLKAKGGLKPQDASTLLRLEANALLSQNEFNAAETLLAEARRNAPVDPAPLDLLSQLYSLTGRTNQALEMIDLWQGLRPTDLSVSLRRSRLYMNMGQFEPALAILEKVLKQQPENEIGREQRGSCLLRLQRLDEARKDFEFLARRFPERDALQFTLGAIAERKNDKPLAISYYKRYLELAAADSQEAAQVRVHLEQLQSGGRTP